MVKQKEIEDIFSFDEEESEEEVDEEELVKE